MAEAANEDAAVACAVPSALAKGVAASRNPLKTADTTAPGDGEMPRTEYFNSLLEMLLVRQVVNGVVTSQSHPLTNAAGIDMLGAT